MKQTRYRPLKFLLTPSLSSFFIAVFLVTIVIADFIIGSGQQEGIFYERFFGQDSTPAIIETANTTWANFSTNVFGNSALNKVLLAVFWMLVGLVVYVVIGLTRSYTSGIAQLWNEMHYVHAKSQDIELRVGLRIFARSVAFLAWAGYSLLFFSVLFPLALFCIKNALVSLHGWQAMGFLFFGIVELLVCLHLFVVLLRLTFLRVRLFGLPSYN